jgi:antibiotic biosynthesis monooxygenase (ABM) superfamily enzyme
MKQVKKWKMALLVWSIIYPTITAITLLLGSWLITLPVYVRTFVMSAILVPFMIFVAMPFLTKQFNNWLTK